MHCDGFKLGLRCNRSHLHVRSRRDASIVQQCGPDAPMVRAADNSVRLLERILWQRLARERTVSHTEARKCGFNDDERANFAPRSNDVMIIHRTATNLPRSIPRLVARASPMGFLVSASTSVLSFSHQLAEVCELELHTPSITDLRIQHNPRYFNKQRSSCR